MKNSRYHLKLRFVFYDVFGLDDEDLIEYGASSDSWMNSDASIGITAWWQLQHQYAYAPLVTRIIVDKTMRFLPYERINKNNKTVQLNNIRYNFRPCHLYYLRRFGWFFNIIFNNNVAAIFNFNNTNNIHKTLQK